MAAVINLLPEIADLQIFLPYLVVYLQLSYAVVGGAFTVGDRFADPKRGFPGESAPRLVARQANDCTTVCSWITQIESCNNDVACDCQIIAAQGTSGIAACANCLYDPLNSTLATLADEVVEVGQDCGVNAAGLVTFILPVTTASTATSTSTASTTSSKKTSTTQSESLASNLPSTTSTHTTTSTTSSTSTKDRSTTSSTSSATSRASQTSQASHSLSSSSNGLSSGAIGGIVGGIVGFFLILAGLMIWLIRRHKRLPPPVPQMEESTSDFWDVPSPVADEGKDVPSARLRYPLDFPEGSSDPAGGRLSRVY